MAGFTTSNLTNYVTEDVGELRAIAIYGPVTIPLVTVYNGIKSAEKLNYFDIAPKMQADAACAAINPSGSTTFSQITLTVDKIMYEDGYCFADLEAKYTQKYLKPGSKLDGNEPTELMNSVMTRYAEQIANIHESAIWQSSKTQGGSNTNYKQFNGFIQTLDTLGTFVSNQTTAGTSYTSITVANVVTIFNNQWLAVPAAMKRQTDLVTVCGDDTFDKLIIALTTQNLYHYSGAEQAGRKITLPGTNMVIQAVPGLNSDNNTALPAAFKNRIFTFYKSNLIVGTDEINDATDWSTWYEKKDDKFYMRSRFKLTTGVFFPQHVVSFATV